MKNIQCKIKCRSEADVYCPGCGSTNIVARGRATSHCGNCGAGVIVEIMQQDADNEKSEKFKQLSLFK